MMIPPESFYFAFVDGALSYDCVTCGAKCCHGLGLGMSKSAEMPGLLKKLNSGNRNEVSSACFTLRRIGLASDPVRRKLAELRSSPARDIRNVVRLALGGIDS